MKVMILLDVRELVYNSAAYEIKTVQKNDNYTKYFQHEI